MIACSRACLVIGDWISLWNKSPERRANVQQILSIGIGASVIADIAAVDIKSREVLKSDAANLTHFSRNCLAGGISNGSQSHQ